MLTASRKINFHALPNSGSRSSLTISRTQCSSTSSLSFSLLRTVKARTSSALAGSVCSRWDSMRVWQELTKKKKKINKDINLLTFSAFPGIVPQLQRRFSTSAPAAHGASGGWLPREQTALCRRDHLWTDQRLQALELLKGMYSYIVMWCVLCRMYSYIHLCSFTGWEPLGAVVSTAPYRPVQHHNWNLCRLGHLHCHGLCKIFSFVSIMSLSFHLLNLCHSYFLPYDSVSVHTGEQGPT